MLIASWRLFPKQAISFRQSKLHQVNCVQSLISLLQRTDQNASASGVGGGLFISAIGITVNGNQFRL